MKQIRFYTVSLEEEQALVDFLRQKRDVKIVAYTSRTPELETSEVMPDISTNQNFRYCYLWDATNSPPPVNRFVPERNLYIVDQFVTEAIEFTRCSVRLKDDPAKVAKPGEALIDSARFFVRIGRIAIDYRFWVGETLVERLALNKFFEQARKWIKKNCVYSPDGHHYVFPSAAEFFEKGGLANPY